MVIPSLSVLSVLSFPLLSGLSVLLVGVSAALPRGTELPVPTGIQNDWCPLLASTREERLCRLGPSNQPFRLALTGNTAQKVRFSGKLFASY